MMTKKCWFLIVPGSVPHFQTENGISSLPVDAKCLKIQQLQPPSTKNNLSLIHLQVILRRRFRNPFITLTEKQRNHNVLRVLDSKRKFKATNWDVIEMKTPTKQSPSPSFATFKCNPSTPINENVVNVPDAPAGDNLTSSTDSRFSDLQKNLQGNIFGCEANDSDIELMEEIKSNAEFWRNIELNYELATANSSSTTLSNVLPLSPIKKTNKINKLSLSGRSTAIRGCELDPQLESIENKENKDVKDNRKGRLAALNITVTPLNMPSLKRKAVDVFPDEETASPPRKKTFIQTKITTSFASPPATPPATPPAQMPWQVLKKMLPSCWLDIIKSHVEAHNSLEHIHYNESTDPQIPVTLLCGCTKL